MALWLLLAGVASAQDIPANVTTAIQLFVDHGYVTDPEALNDTRGITTVGLHGMGTGFDGTVGYADFTLALGLGGGGGFAYNAEFLLGVGSWLGEYVAVAAGGGIGGNSVYHRLPAAFRVPLRVVVLAQHPEAFTLELFGGFEYVPAGSNPRKDGWTTIDFLDEFKWGANLYLGAPGYADQETPNTGLSLGFTWYETMGTTIYEGRIAFSAASRPELKPKKKKKKRKRRRRHTTDSGVSKPPKPPSGPRQAD